MKKYKTIREVKQNLPEILDRLATCKKNDRITTFLLKDIQDSIIEELTNPDVDYGWITSEQYYNLILEFHTATIIEIKYLNKILKQLLQYKNTVF